MIMSEELNEHTAKILQLGFCGLKGDVLHCAGYLELIR